MKYVIKKQVLWRAVDDEIVIVDPETENYSYLNATGKEVWGMVDAGLAVEEIVRSLAERYDAPEEQIRKDTQSLLQELFDAGLIKES